MEPKEQAKAGGGVPYDVKVALEFFKLAGEIDTFVAGATIFSANEKTGIFSLKRSKMYLLLEGQVNLVANGNFLDMLGPGEIFGEMASLSQAPRSASAMARSACRVISLDDRQFQSALQTQPDFALMMMSMIIGRLRKSLAQVMQKSPNNIDIVPGESRALDRKLLNELLQELGDDARMRYEKGRGIIQEGQVGVLMYILLDGKVSISMQGRFIEKIGSGSIFGEMALIEKAPRMASAMADSDCSVLAINRNAFLDLVKRKPQFGMSLLSAIGERARITTLRI